jgi:hypothetical protein
MWTMNVILTSRVYLNLVWLVKRPDGLSEYQARTSAMPSGAVTGVGGVGTIGGTNWRRARHESKHRSMGLGLGRERRSGAGISFGESGENEYRISKWDGDSITELSTMPSAIPHSPHSPHSPWSPHSPHSRSPSH